MGMLIAAALFFLAIHLLVSGTSLRDVIVGSLGERPFQALFSLASLGGIIWLALSYNAATAQGSEVLWDLGVGFRYVGVVVVAIAFLFVVVGLLTPNPTTVGMEDRAARDDTVRGLLRITRHPFLWGVALWAAYHVLANGDAASIVFFATFLVLAVVGTYSIDAKRARRMGDAWQGFAKRTSNIPFAAIVDGRNTFKLGEVATYREAIALAVFVVFLFTHAGLFNTSPL